MVCCCWLVLCRADEAVHGKPFEAHGGLFAEEAINLLQQFYVCGNPTGAAAVGRSVGALASVRTSERVLALRRSGRLRKATPNSACACLTKCLTLLICHRPCKLSVRPAPCITGTAVFMPTRSPSLTDIAALVSSCACILCCCLQPQNQSVL
jgi:hypothetical protein